jgi:hypothetical protein
MPSRRRRTPAGSRRPHGVVYGFDPADVDWLDDELRGAVELDDAADDRTKVASRDLSRSSRPSRDTTDSDGGVDTG